ncbi:MAG: LPS assembly protein LptD [Candidatus Aminicenantes bacterium]|nr:LPS assembly protein LptD [Candidatus Aminicenantes bacterium]
MNRRLAIPGLVILAGLAFLLPPAAGQASAPAAKQGRDKEVRIISGGLKRDKELVIAEKDVEIQYGDLELFADRAEYNSETKDVLVEGNVVIRMPKEVISAERAVGNLETRMFRIEKAFGMVQPTVFYRAQEIDRQDPNLYALRKASLTTCSQAVPRWEFSFRRAELVKGSHVSMWGAVFRLKNVPVFYLPYMRYPLERERTTGLLSPEIGYTEHKGFTLSQSFYWAFARNMDLTLTADIYSARGIGGGLEYRYLLAGGVGGEARVYLFRFRRDEFGQQPDNAYILRLKHSQPLPAGFRLVANVDYQSSFEFLREFDNNFRRAVVSNRRSEVYLARSWANASLSARASRFETYFRSIDNSIVMTYLPQVNFSLSSTPLWRGSPVYFTLGSSLTSWEYGWSSAYAEGVQRKSTNLVLSPVLSLPLRGLPWLDVMTSVAANLQYYGQSYQPNTRRVTPEPIFVPRFSANVEIRGPKLYRLFYGGDGEAKVKHVIEPFVQYSYDSPVDQSSRVVTPYGYYRYHQIRYGITNHFLARVNGMPRSVVQVEAEQTTYLSPEDGPLSQFTVDGRIPRSSEVNGRLRLDPGRGYNVDFGLAYNPYKKAVSMIRLSAGLGSYASGTSLSVSWFKSLNAWVENIPPELRDLYNRHQIAAWGQLRLPALNLDLFGDVDFNIQERQLLYTAGRAVYHYQCLDFTAEVRVFYFRARPEAQFKFSLGLGTITPSSDFLSGLGF